MFSSQLYIYIVEFLVRTSCCCVWRFFTDLVCAVWLDFSKSAPFVITGSVDLTVKVWECRWDRARCVVTTKCGRRLQNSPSFFRTDSCQYQNEARSSSSRLGRVSSAKSWSSAFCACRVLGLWKKNTNRLCLVRCAVRFGEMCMCAFAPPRWT